MAVEREYVENLSLARDPHVLMTLPVFGCAAAASVRLRTRPTAASAGRVVAFVVLLVYLAVAFATTHIPRGNRAQDG